MRSVIDDLRKGLAEQRIADADVERMLTASDRQLLREEVVDVAWYGIDVYRRMGELLEHCCAGGDPDYFKKRGAATAQRLLGLGVYQQLSFLRRVNATQTLEIAHQSLKLTATLWNSLFNFGSWSTSYDPEAGVIAIAVTDSAPMPRQGWDAIEGFIARLVSELNAQDVHMVHARQGTGSERFEFRITQSAARSGA